MRFKLLYKDDDWKMRIITKGHKIFSPFLGEALGQASSNIRYTYSYWRHCVVDCHGYTDAAFKWYCKIKRERERDYIDNRALACCEQQCVCICISAHRWILFSIYLFCFTMSNIDAVGIPCLCVTAPNTHTTSPHLFSLSLSTFSCPPPFCV